MAVRPCHRGQRWRRAGPAAFFVAVCAASLLYPAGAQNQVPQLGPTVYVSATGNDVGTGAQESPVRTIRRALALTTAGGLVMVGPGVYPAFVDSTHRVGDVVVRGAGQGAVRIAGATLAGAHRLRFEGVSFEKKVTVTEHPSLRQRQTSADIEFRGVRFTDGGDVCLFIRSGAARVVVRRSRFERCSAGIGGPGGTAPSRDILIEDNLLLGFTADAIQFGEWSNVVIQRNVIGHIRDPRGITHNDGIQFTGGSTNVSILDNVIFDSAGQLLFIQDARNPIHNVLVQNNLIFRSDAVAVQSQGATGVRFINNTIWQGGLGGLLLRQSGRTSGKPGPVPTDTVLVNNILSGYGQTGGARPATQVANFIFHRTFKGRRGPNLYGQTPGFNNLELGDYRLSRFAILRGQAFPPAPERDLCGRSRGPRPSIGALEPALGWYRGGTNLLRRLPTCFVERPQRAKRRKRAHRRKRVGRGRQLIVGKQAQRGLRVDLWEADNLWQPVKVP